MRHSGLVHAVIYGTAEEKYAVGRHRLKQRCEQVIMDVVCKVCRGEEVPVAYLCTFTPIIEITHLTTFQIFLLKLSIFVVLHTV